jgi:DNA-binding transcriptional MocR family regulator
MLYTIPTVQNPTGVVMSEDRRETIADIARRRKITILEDDIYAFLMEQPPPPLAVFAPERTYFVTSLSKSLFPGLRLGFVACPPGTAEAVASQVRMSLLATSPLMAAIGTRWLRDGTADRVAAWKRGEVRARWEMAVQRFGAPTKQPFAAHLWLPLPAAWQTDEFVARARARGVVVAGAESFAVGPEPAPRAVRICLGVPATRPRLQEALDMIHEIRQTQAAPVQLV